MNRRELRRADDLVVSIAHGSRGTIGEADRVARDELHDTRNVLANASEEYHGRNDNVGRFDTSGAHSCQRHEENTGREGEEAQGSRICQAAVVYRHPRLAAVIGALALQILLSRRRSGRHAGLGFLAQGDKTLSSKDGKDLNTAFSKPDHSMGFFLRVSTQGWGKDKCGFHVV